MNHRSSSTCFIKYVHSFAKTVFLSLGFLAFGLTAQVHATPSGYALNATINPVGGSTGDTTTYETIPLQATVQVSPPQITIQVYVPGTFTINRKDPSVNTWTQVATSVTLALNGTWTDKNVNVGQMYEYQFVNTAGNPWDPGLGVSFYPSGYILTGINVDQTQPKGMMAVICANDFAANLPSQYAQYKSDLVADGWQVRELQVPRAPDYSGLGNGAIATIKVNAGGQTTMANNSQVLLTNPSGKEAMGTATVNATTGAITAVSSSVSSGGVTDPGSAGRGFAVGDVLTMSGGSLTTGSTAYLTANITNPTPGVLSYADPITGGSGYTNGQTVTLQGQTSGATASGTLGVTNGTINSITVSPSGQAGIFQGSELLTMTGNTTGSGVGPITAQQVTYNSLITGDVTIASGGSGYTNGAFVELEGQTSGEYADADLVVNGSGQITGFTITYSDAGFIVGEKLTIAYDSGSGSGVGTLTVNAVSTGLLEDVQLNAPGTGYTNGETGTLTGNQSGATAQVTLNVYSGYLNSATVVSSNSGFISGETLTLSGTASGTGAPFFTATVTTTGTLSSVTVNSGGTGYVSGPVQITEGTATATGTLTVASGVITGVTVTTPGPGFTAGGYLTLVPSTTGVSLSVLTLNNNNRGSLVAITSGGSGYSDNDTVTIKGGSSGATAIGSLIAPSGTITGISVVLANTGNAGSFTTGESLTITPTLGGSGATATVGAPTDNHLQIRSAVQAIYNAFYNNATQQSLLKNIVMVGKVPVCRSGLQDGGGADGHGNECPYAADAFYAEMLGVIGVDWTDVGNNIGGVYTDVNLPGDMQFDQQKISDLFNGTGKVELGFGRIDLSTNIGSEVDAEAVYFNKLHLYKIADPSFQPGRKVCDRAGWAQVRETNLQSMPGVVGMSNITFIAQSDLPAVQTGQDADQLYSTNNGPYLFFFKDSGGPETGVNGKAVFWTGMQSHWGYWAYNNSMVTDLAETGFTLDFTWDIFGTRYLYHRMGMGLDAADMMKQSINNQGWTNGPYTYHYDQEWIGESNCQLFMDQMGDPALRFFMFAPPTGLSVISTAGNPVLTWIASTEPTVTGYHVYRAPYASGQFTRLTTTPVSATGSLTYTDTTATPGSYVYMVRAIRTETTGGGTFYNASLGATQSFNLGAAPTSVSITTASSSTIYWNTASSITLTAQGGDPQYTWAIINGTLPSGLTLSPATGVVSGTTQAVGNFTITVQATDQIGQTATQVLTIIINPDSQVTLNPVACTYTQSSTPTSSYGTFDPDDIAGGSIVDETFHRYNLSGVNVNNGLVKATLYLYVEPNTTAGAFAPVQANLLTDAADSPANFIDNGIAVPFTGAAASPTSGWTRVTCPVPYGFTNGTLVTLAGLTGFPTTAYPLTVIDAYNFDIHITYGSWAYDPELAFASSIATTYSTRPTAYDPNVSTVTATGTDTPGTYLQFDVTTFVNEALTKFPDKLMGIRFFTGTPQTVAVGGLHAFGAAIPYLVIQTSNAPSIVFNSPTLNPAYIYTGSSILLNTTVTPLASRAAALTLQWSQVSGPGTTTFTNPTAAVTGATFSTPGSYVLQLTANDGVESSTQAITVVTQNNPVTGPNDSMVLRLPFDETSGTVAHDYSGVSPANNGALTADPASNTLPTWTSSGKISGALSFAGNNSPGNYQQVVVPDSTTNLLDGMQQMTISFWLYANALPYNGTSYGNSYAGLIVKRLGSFNKESYTIQLRGSSATTASIYTDIGGTGSATLEGSGITTGQWYHCVVMFDGTQPNNNNFSQYLNGSPIKVISTNQTSVPRNSTANLHIGAYDTVDTNANNAAFNGIIDEVRIYNRLLTFPEIQALYQAVPSDVGPVITTASPLSGAVGNPLALSATVTDSKGPGSLSYIWSELNGPSTLTIASPTSIATTTTPSVPGAYNLQFSANDGVITTVANVAATITGQTYATWATQNNLTGNNALKTAVIANDGLNNLYKYALGLTPATNYNPGDPHLPSVVQQNVAGTNYLTLSFNGVATDVTYTVQATSNLNGPWTTIKTFPSGGTAPGPQTVQDTQAIGATGQRYMQLIMSNP